MLVLVLFTTIHLRDTYFDITDNILFSSDRFSRGFEWIAFLQDILSHSLCADYDRQDNAQILLVICNKYFLDLFISSFWRQTLSTVNIDTRYEFNFNVRFWFFCASWTCWTTSVCFLGRLSSFQSHKKSLFYCQV